MARPTGELVLHGRIMPASNATFVGEIDGVRVVYKPIAGERPLWDFPDGTLADREVAAYVVSEALGWNVVPETWLRDGPHGPGMVQRWQEPDDEQAAVDAGARGRGAARLPPRLRRHRRPRPAGLAGARGHGGPAPDGGLRRGGQQRRPQGRSRPGDGRRPPLRRRPRRHLPHRPQAAHRAVGLAGRAADRGGGGGGERCAAAATVELGAALAGHLTDLEIDGIARRCDRLLARDRCRPRAATGRRSRGRRSEAPWP